jgi:hypothetical protein
MNKVRNLFLQVRILCLLCLEKMPNMLMCQIIGKGVALGKSRLQEYAEHAHDNKFHDKKIEDRHTMQKQCINLIFFPDGYLNGAMYAPDLGTMKYKQDFLSPYSQEPFTRTILELALLFQMRLNFPTYSVLKVQIAIEIL